MGQTTLGDMRSHGQDVIQTYMKDHMGDHGKMGAYMSLKAHNHKGNHGHMILRAHKGAYVKAHGFMILKMSWFRPYESWKS